MNANEALPVALAVLGLQRVAELAYARHTARALAAAGARRVAHDGYLLLVAVHVAWFAGMAVESWHWTAEIGWWTIAAGCVFIVGQFLRYWSMWALGPRWNVRVWVLPAAPLVGRGPYRWLRHPIYLGVFLELLGFPLAFGLWRTALLIATIHFFALRHRIRLEERALGLRPSGVAARP